MAIQMRLVVPKTISGYKVVVSLLIFTLTFVCFHVNALTFQDGELSIYPQTGHADGVLSLALSPNGEILATGSKDRTIRLWNTNTGTELRTFRSQYGIIVDLLFSADGDYLFSTESQMLRSSTITRWDIKTGESIRIKESEVITAFALSSDSKMLAYSQPNGHINLLSLASNSILLDQPIFSGDINSIEFSADGQSLLVASNRGEVVVWNIQRNQIVAEYSHQKSVAAARFCGMHCVISGSWDGEVIQWDLQKNQQITSTLLNAHITDISVNEKNNLVAISSRKNTNNQSGATQIKQLALYDLKNLKPIGSVNTGRAIAIDAVKFHPNGLNVIASSRNGAVRMYDIQNQNQRVNFQGKASQEYAISVAAKRNKAVTISDGSRLSVWDLVTGQLELLLLLNDREKGVITTADISAEASYVLMGTKEGDLRLYDLEDSSLMVCNDDSDGDAGKIKSVVMHARFLPDDNMAMLVLDAPNSTIRSSIMVMDDDCQVKKQKDFNYDIYTAAIFPSATNNRMAIFGDGKLQLLDLDVNPIATLWSMDFPAGAEKLAFSPDGYYLAVINRNHQLTVLNTASRQQQFDFVELFGYRHSVSFSADGKTLTTGGRLSWDNQAATSAFLLTYDVNSGKLLKKTGFDSSILGLRHSAAENQLLVSSARGIDIIEPQSHQTLLTLSGTKDGEWIAVTPKGYYSSSEEGGESVFWIRKNSTTAYSSAQFAAAANKPEIIKAVLADSHSPSFPGPSIGVPPTLEVINVDGALTEKKSYQLQLRGNSYNNQDNISLTILRNGATIINRDTISLPDKVNFQRSYSIDLQPGENVIMAVLQTDSGLVSNPAVTRKIYQGVPTRTRELRSLYIGVSDYPKWGKKDLPAVLNDAKNFKELSRIIAGDYSSASHLELLNSDVSKQNVQEQLSTLSETMPDDLVIIYLAGHGDRDSQGFYYMTPDANIENPSAGAIRFDDIAKHLKNIKARTLLLLDACHSSQVTQVTNQEIAAQLNQEFSSNVMVFSASKGRQQAQEDLESNESHFMKALLASVMTDGADRNQNGYLELSELVDYSTFLVKKSTMGAQHPWLSQRSYFGDFPVVKLN